MDKPWEVEGCTDAELAEAYFNSWQSALAAIAEKDSEIERLNEHLAEKDNEISDLKRGDELYRKWVEDTQKWLMR